MPKHVWYKNPTYIYIGLLVCVIGYAYSQQTNDPRFVGGGRVGRMYIGQTHASWVGEATPLDTAAEPSPKRQHTAFGGGETNYVR